VWQIGREKKWYRFSNTPWKTRPVKLSATEDCPWDRVDVGPGFCSAEKGGKEKSGSRGGRAVILILEQSGGAGHVMKKNGRAKEATKQVQR